MRFPRTYDFVGRHRTTLRIRIDRDDELEDVFDRGQSQNVMSFSALDVPPRLS